MPYLEDDVPKPLNVYGACKAEVERRVMDVLPNALLIRTSVPFGPWDDGTFLGSVFRALDRGERFRAPIDNVMSPTYIPDLVHAVLDLLIDKESGVWHLVNEGAVTWFDLARGAAQANRARHRSHCPGRNILCLESGGASAIQCALKSASQDHAATRGRAGCLRGVVAERRASDRGEPMRLVLTAGWRQRERCREATNRGNPGS